jgi:hypothetical protein
VEFFKAIEDGQAEATFIAKNDAEARLLIKNNTKQPLNLKLPGAFAGVPVLAQFGGGGGGRGGGGVGGGGGGGGFFSVPPEQTAKIDMAVLCLDHGLRDPSSSRPYKIVPAAAHVDRPAVIELLQAFGRGELDHGAAQAAAWHLNSDLSWDELAAKLQGTRRSFRRPPYFSREQIQAGMAYAAEANRLAEINWKDHEREIKAHREKAESIDSEARSTADDEANEPEASNEESDTEAGIEAAE